jgi:hypothetical protein
MPQHPVPNASGPASLQKRCASLGTTFMVISIVELAYGVLALVGPLLRRPMLELQRGMFSDASPPAMGAMLGAGEDFMNRIALWEALRAVPFAVTAALLLRIALRLRKGDASALRAAQRWVPWALGAIAVSLAIQAMVTVPATLEYQRKLLDVMPMPSARGGGALPIDIQRMTSAITTVSVIFGAAMGGLFWVIWPVTLHFWTRKILRDTGATPS